MPRLSVILPAHNAEHTIGRAVRSTLASMDADSELVVFDDASTDGTVGVLETIADRRLRMVSSPVSLGVAGALNALLEATDSELVARMDADDAMLRRRLARQRRAIDGGLDVVFTTVVLWRPDRHTMRPPAPASIGPDAFRYHLLVTNPVAHSTMFARRAPLERAGGYRAVPSEDYDLWVRLAIDGARMARLGLPGLLYRVHPNQITSSMEWRHSSWLDPTLGESFADLSESLLGERFSRLTTLGFTAPDRRTFDDKAAAFRAAFLRGTAALPRGPRMVLERELGDRTAAAANVADGRFRAAAS